MRLVFVLLVLSVSAGCSVEVSQNDLKKKKPPKSVTTSSPYAVKISGGANQVSATDVKASISIGMKDRQVSSASYKASVSISSARPQP